MYPAVGYIMVTVAFEVQALCIVAKCPRMAGNLVHVPLNNSNFTNLELGVVVMKGDIMEVKFLESW